MGVDTFTESLRVVVFVGFSVACAYIAVAYIKIRLDRRIRPYDWQVDGECNNNSHPRVLP